MRKKKEEELAMWEEYMDQRKQARIKEEEDLKKLKERQVSCGASFATYNSETVISLIHVINPIHSINSATPKSSASRA